MCTNGPLNNSDGVFAPYNRIVVLMDYARRGMLIRFVGTHEQYDKISDIERI